jgi:hypothetical protein
VFSENFPITDSRNNFVLEFIDYFIDPPRYAIEECIERGLTYSVPLKAKLKLYCTDPEHEDLPTMLPVDGALPSFDVDEAGSFVLGLLENAGAREGVVAGIREAAAGLTWDRTAAGYLDVYGRSLARDPRPVSRALATFGVGRVELTPRESLLLDVYRRRRGFRLAVDGGLSLGASVLAMIRRVRSPTRGDGGR